MSQSQPKVLVDHCLETIQFPAYLRAKGLDAATMLEEFQRPNVLDIEWIELAGKNQWLVFTKDAAIRRNAAERNAVIEHRLRLFCLVNQQISITESIEIFEKHWKALTKWFDAAGPWIVVVRKSGIERIKLKS